MNNLYEIDFQKWIDTTIYNLKHGRFGDLDIEHLIEELEDLGKSEKRALESNLVVLIAHLLKLDVQFDAPIEMKNSWIYSVVEHRKRVLLSLKKTPSLKSYLLEAIENSYQDSRDLAIKEGQLASFGIRKPDEIQYPLDNPFSIDELLNEDFLGKYISQNQN
jgi:Domain of unknown function DUF29